jgi:hypothetical protein
MDEINKSYLSKKNPFGNFSQADIKNLDYTDPDLAQFLDIDPIPDFNDYSEEEKRIAYRSLYIGTIIKTKLIDDQRSQLFDMIEKINANQPDNTDNL